MTHWSKPTGIASIGVVYLALSAAILWGPPPVKAAAGAILYPAPPYLMETALYAFGYGLGSGIGHGDDSPSKMDVFTGLIEDITDECDPFHPDYYQRCLGVTPF